MKAKKRILTGDRPTGKLHLGHYVGTLANRVRLQDRYECFFIIADLHVLTTRIEKEKIAKVKQNIHDLVLDYLSVGIDPGKAVIYQQSLVPEVAYLALLFSMLVSVPRCQRVPTLKEVMHDLKIQSPSLGLLTYPVLQAADILMVKGNLVPVGKDQESHIELTRVIAKRFNLLYGEIFPFPEALIGEVPTLPGTDGQTKMSKSVGNCIYLSDNANEVRRKVMAMYTDPTRVHPTDPGHVEGNPVFVYHEAFNNNQEEVERLKQRYQKGQVGDVEVKEKLVKALNLFLDPIRARRRKYESQPEAIEEIIKKGSQTAQAEAQKTLKEVKKAMGLA
ncbi:MAG: tryptophan--tRNA ligase [Candidatus Pacebacteria bacterium]|nr:tryptophan--tRNA ligase [Candidatus Paceibacterota bacterium]